MTWEEFQGRHPDELRKVFDMLLGFRKNRPQTYALSEQLSKPPVHPPLPLWMIEAKKTPIVRLLAAAARENCRNAFNDLLYFWLRRLGIRIPEGVLAEPRQSRGRPRTASTMYDVWIQIGRPQLCRKTLAAAVYGEEFLRANAADRKRLIDRCRKAVGRHQQRQLGQKSPK